MTEHKPVAPYPWQIAGTRDLSHFTGIKSKHGEGLFTFWQLSKITDSTQ